MLLRRRVSDARCYVCCRVALRYAATLILMPPIDVAFRHDARCVLCHGFSFDYISLIRLPPCIRRHFAAYYFRLLRAAAAITTLLRYSLRHATPCHVASAIYAIE